MGKKAPTRSGLAELVRLVNAAPTPVSGGTK